MASPPQLRSMLERLAARASAAVKTASTSMWRALDPPLAAGFEDAAPKCSITLRSARCAHCSALATEKLWRAWERPRDLEEPAGARFEMRSPARSSSSRAAARRPSPQRREGRWSDQWRDEFRRNACCGIPNEVRSRSSKSSPSRQQLGEYHVTIRYSPPIQQNESLSV